MKSERPTGEEMAAYTAGLADPLTTRRVLAAALADVWVRRRLAALESVEAETGTAEKTARAERLRAALMDMACSVAGSVAHNEIVVPEPNTLRQAVTVAAEAMNRLVERVLLTGKQFLTLPCLAPASAASAPDLLLRRQSVTTGEGVRLEFQQLPGGAPHRLRIIVDASEIDTGNKTEQTPADSVYEVAYLTLEEGTETPLPDSVSHRHVLVVALNREGKGFTDFTVGGSVSVPGRQNLPAPQAPLSLLSVTLTRKETQAGK